MVNQYNLPGNIYDIIFATSQQKIVGKVLINCFKENNSEMSKTEMSLFATKLHEGELITQIDEEPYKGKTVKLSYNKRQFYDRILTPLRAMGIIDYDLYKRTYKLSENFNKLMIRIGLIWIREIRKHELQFKVKTAEM
ncbi:MAG: hypothetical protein AABX32_03460 [Nanoarchaeota archaeon]